MKDNVIHKVFRKLDIDEIQLNIKSQEETNKLNKLLEEIDKECKLKPYMKIKIYEKIFDYIESENKNLQKSIKKIFKCGIEKTIEVIFFSKTNVRDNFIELLEREIITNREKQQFLEILMNVKTINLIQKERFILYYGLDSKMEKVHSFAKIAKLQNCSSANIRQGIENIKSKLLRLPLEEMKKLEEILENHISDLTFKI